MKSIFNLSKGILSVALISVAFASLGRHNGQHQ